MVSLQDFLIPLSQLPYFAIGAGLFLSIQGLRKGSLSPSGAFSAAIVGSTIMAVQLKAFGVSCIVFYLVGSKATKVGKNLKGQLEADHTAAGSRTGWQVVSNIFSALFASILWSALFVQDSLWSKLLPNEIVSHGRPLDIQQECPISPTMYYSRFLVFVALGHFACCLGDTLASELGILSPARPILITTLKPVPPGTNGAMSLVGTAVSFLGGGLIGLTIAITLLIQSTACRTHFGSVIYGLVGWGFVAGGIGSLLDSIMGATIQRTRYSKKSKKILQDDSVAGPEDEITTISGLNILTNGQINLLSSAITSLLIAILASR